MKIRLKLLLSFLLVSIIPLFTISFINFRQAYREIRSSTLYQLNLVADHKTEKIDVFFDERIADISIAKNFLNIRLNLPVIIELQDNQNSEEYRLAKESLDNQLYPFIEAYSYKNLLLFDLDGNVVYTANPTRQSDFKSESVAKTLEKSFNKGKNTIYISHIFQNQNINNETELLISAPIYNYDTELIGVIALNVNIDLLYDYIQDSISIGKEDEILITYYESNSNKNVTVFNPKSDTLYTTTNTDNDVIYNSLEDEAGISHVIDDDESVISAWRYIPKLKWGVIITTNEVHASSTVNKLTEGTVIRSLLVITIVSILALYIAHTISTPIIQLTKSAEKIKNKEYDLPTLPLESKNEIGQLARTIRNLSKTLQQSEQNKYEFISSASHQLRTPVSGVSLQLGILLQKLKNHKNSKKLVNEVNEIINNNERIVAIINDLFTYMELGSSYEPQDLEEVNAYQLVQDIIESYEEKILTQKLTVQNNVPKDLVIKVEEEKIKTVLYNLLTNAIEYSKDGGNIEINTENTNNAIKISIKDDGIGIPQRDSVKIFDTFFRAENAYTKSSVGTGLGLVICKMIIEGHGGEISFTSKENKGSTFWFTLPNSHIASASQARQNTNSKINGST